MPENINEMDGNNDWIFFVIECSLGSDFHPAQVLAYHIAVFQGLDVEQPRNLAKSVTIE